MLISYEDKVRIAQESLTQPSANQIAEATGIHRSVVQKALNDPEVIELQDSFKSVVHYRYIKAFESNHATSNPNQTESNAEAEPNQTALSVSEAAELRIREVEALESIAISLASLRSIFETQAKNADTANHKSLSLHGDVP